MLWVGLMSGTSADAIDAALVELGSSARELSLLAFTSIELPENLRKRIHALVQSPVRVRDLVELDVELGERFAAAVLAVLSEGGVAPEQVAGKPCQFVDVELASAMSASRVGSWAMRLSW